MRVIVCKVERMVFTFGLSALQMTDTPDPSDGGVALMAPRCCAATLAAFWRHTIHSATHVFPSF